MKLVSRFLFITVALALLLVITAFAQNQTEELSLEQTLEIFQSNSVMVEYSSQGQARLESAITTLKQAIGVSDELDEMSEDEVAKFPVDFEKKDLVNKLSQAYYTLGNVFLDDDENEPVYIKGKHWGLKSLRMNPEFADLWSEEGFVDAVKVETDVPALYWTNSNWLRWAQKHPLKAVFAGVTKKTVAIAERTLELDETYLCYGPYRTLGAYYSGLPGMLQKLDKTLSYLCNVVDEPEICTESDTGELDPICSEYFENRTFFVEFYLMKKDMWEDAERILQAVLDEPIGDKFPLYNALSKQNAARLLEEVNEHL